MRAVILILLMLFSDPADIARINKLKSEAEEAFRNGNYELAAEKYRFLTDSMGVQEDEVSLNLAHCYYNLNDTSHAKTSYQQLAQSDNEKLKSIAYQQLGVMAKKSKKLEESLQYLKSSLRTDPANEEARYNYEVVKKLLENQQKQQQKQNQDQQNKDQQSQDQQNKDQQKQDQQQQDQQKGEQDQQQQQQQDQQQQEGKEGEQQKNEQQQQQEGKEQQGEQKNQDLNTQQKLEEMNISEEKARMILEAMKNKEIQYIQQRKRKATQPQDDGKPDW